MPWVLRGYGRKERQKDSGIHTAPTGQRRSRETNDDGKLLTKSSFTGGK